MKILLTALALAAAQFAAAAPGDDYPAKEIKVVVPLAPGGGTDTITRQLADRLAKQIGKPIVIENRGGAGTTIGMHAVATAPADGYTLVTNGDTAAIFEYIFASPKVDTLKDFVTVAYFASAPIVLAAHPSFPAGNVKELVELAKRSPGQLNYATPGVGTPHDLAGLLMQHKAGVKFNAITYKGNGPALTDLLAGHVQFGMFTISSVLQYVQSGKLKAIAVVGDRRTSLAPDLPSMGESGLPGVDVSSRYILLAPAATPPAAVTRLHDAVMATVKQPEAVQAFHKLGYEPMTVTQKEATALMRNERDRWGPILKAANVRPE